MVDYILYNTRIILLTRQQWHLADVHVLRGMYCSELLRWLPYVQPVGLWEPFCALFNPIYFRFWIAAWRAHGPRY